MTRQPSATANDEPVIRKKLTSDDLDRLVALAQGAAQHLVDGENGVNDLDVWTFFARRADMRAAVVDSGFRSGRASALGFISPHPKIPDDALMVKRLAGYSPDLAGRIVYPAAFDALGY